MAANADVVLRRFYPTRKDLTATAGELIRAFVARGYGVVRAEKWIQTFLEYDILQVVGKTEDGKPLLSCLWWDRP